MARHLIQNPTTGATRIVGDAALPFFPGYAVVDTYDDGIPPRVFYGAGEADLRYVNVTELSDPASAASVALRAALVPPTADGLDRLASRRSPKLLPWHAALATRYYRRAEVAVLGDSITEGQGATQFDRRWVNRLQAQLRGGAPGGRGFIASSTTGQTTFTHPASMAGGAVASNGYGPKRAAARLNAAGQSVTFTVNGTSCDVLYLQGTVTGTVSISVDGGAATVLDVKGATLLDGRKHRVTFGTRGAHTVTATWASGLAYIHGVIEYDGDENAGITVNDCGHYGWNTGAGGSGWLSATSNWPVAVASLGTDLVIIALGTNDPGVVTPAESGANLAQIITLLRAGYATLGVTAPPIVLAPYGGKATASANWQDFVAAQRAVADTDPLVLLADLSLRLPNAASNPVGIYADTVGHPTDKGHALIGDTLARILSPA